MFEHLGEVPKLAEGTPLERVQVVNSGARVQIPPSPSFRPRNSLILKRLSGVFIFPLHEIQLRYVLIKQPLRGKCAILELRMTILLYILL